MQEQSLIFFNVSSPLHRQFAYPSASPPISLWPFPTRIIRADFPFLLAPASSGVNFYNTRNLRNAMHIKDQASAVGHILVTITFLSKRLFPIVAGCFWHWVKLSMKKYWIIMNDCKTHSNQLLWHLQFQDLKAATSELNDLQKAWEPMGFRAGSRHLRFDAFKKTTPGVSAAFSLHILSILKCHHAIIGKLSGCKAIPWHRQP